KHRGLCGFCAGSPELGLDDVLLRPLVLARPLPRPAQIVEVDDVIPAQHGLRAVARPLHHGMRVHPGVDVVLDPAAPEIMRGATSHPNGVAGAVPHLLEVPEAGAAASMAIESR